MTFAAKTKINPLALVKLVQSAPNRYRMEGSNQLRFMLETDTPSERIAAVEHLIQQLAA